MGWINANGIWIGRNRGGGISWSSYWTRLFGVELSQMALWLESTKKVIGSNGEDAPLLVIGEDDADATAYSEFYDYLKDNNLTGVINVVTSMISLSDAQLLEMQNAGFDILPHSHTHTTDMSGWTDEQIRAEIETSNAVFVAKGLGQPEHWVSPAYNSFNGNVRRVGSEYYKTHRGGVYNPNNTWDTIDRDAFGAFSMILALGDTTDVNAKKSLDIAIANNMVLFVFVHKLNTADKVTRFKSFIDYAIASGIEVITQSQLYSRFEAHQGKYIDQSGSGTINGAFLRNVFEKSTLNGKTGHIIFKDDLATITATKADNIINTYNYKVAFLTDTADAAFAYAIPNATIRATLNAAGIDNLQKLFDFVGGALIYNSKTIVDDIANLGLEYHISVQRLNFSINTITGTIPRSIKNCKRIYEFQGRYNQISGDVPAEIRYLSDLHIFNFADNLLTGYEQGAFAKNLCYLNLITLSNNYLSTEAVNNILIDVRDMVAIHKGYTGIYDFHIGATNLLNIAGRYNQAPSGTTGNPATGIGAAYQLSNAISELGALVDWTVRYNFPTPATTPANYSGLTFWLDAALGITKNVTDKVSQVEDVSASHNHLQQTNDTYKPTWVDAQCNGLPIIRGATSELTTDTAGYALSRAGACIFAVYKSNTIDSQARSLFNHSNSYSYDTMYINWYGGGYFAMVARDNSKWAEFNFAFSNAVFYIVEISANLGEVNAYLNGSLKSTKSPTGDFNINMMLGRSNANAFAGDVAEIIIYNEAVNDDNRLVIRNYLNAKYAIY